MDKTPEIESPETLAKSLGNARNAQQALRVLHKFYAAHNSIVSQEINRLGVNLACRSGCDLCCFLRVGAKAHEILLIAETIKVSWRAEARQTLMEELTKNADIARQMTKDEQCSVNIKCPLLVDHRCSVYSIRPLGCRRHHAQNYDACKFSFDHPTDMTYPGSRHAEYLLRIEYIDSVIADIFQTYRYDQDDYELNIALLEALRPGKSLRRWQDRKKAFVNARQE